MTGTTHQLIALLAAFWILSANPVSVGPLLATLATIAVMVGALTPDLDQPTADLWRRLLGSNHLGNIFRSFSGGHRHFTHSLVGILAVGWGTHWLATNLINPAYLSSSLLIWRAFMIGYVSHPLADTFTDWGVPWFWPWHWNLKIPPGPGEVRVTTDSYVERLFIRAAIIISGVLLLQADWPIIKQFFS